MRPIDVRIKAPDFLIRNTRNILDKVLFGIGIMDRKGSSYFHGGHGKFVRSHENILGIRHGIEPMLMPIKESLQEDTANISFFRVRLHSIASWSKRDETEATG